MYLQEAREEILFYQQSEAAREQQKRDEERAPVREVRSLREMGRFIYARGVFEYAYTPFGTRGLGAFCRPRSFCLKIPQVLLLVPQWFMVLQ
jgi:hypothetical protein